MTNLIAPPAAQYLRDDAIRGGMDLMLFAHQSHLRHSDEDLVSLSLGRAHHRCMYFIARRPGMTVGEMLSMLGVTKQSFGRVLNELMRRNLVERRPGQIDRRQRCLHLTNEGAKLEQRIFNRLHKNMSRAYANSGEDAVQGFWILMQNLMNEESRCQFASFQSTAKVLQASA